MFNIFSPFLLDSLASPIVGLFNALGSGRLYLFFMVGVSLGLSLVLFVLPNILAPKLFVFEKLTAYECGFEPFSSNNDPFESHFVIVGILYLIFDLELLFLFPTVVMPSNAEVFCKCIVPLLLLLTAMMAIEWTKGLLMWPVFITSSAKKSLAAVSLSLTAATKLFFLVVLVFFVFVINAIPSILTTLIFLLVGSLGVVLQLMSYHAEFLAVVFLLLYVGVCAILFLFATMVVGGGKPVSRVSFWRSVGALASVGFFALVFYDLLVFLNFLSILWGSTSGKVVRFIDLWVLFAHEFSDIHILGLHLYSQFRFLTLLSGFLLVLSLVCVTAISMAPFSRRGKK